MASIEKTQHLYEVLIRCDENGFRGAHQVMCECLMEGDTKHHEKLCSPTALEIADVQSLLGEHLTKHATQVDSLLTQVVALELALQKTNEQLATTVKQCENHDKIIADQKAEILSVRYARDEATKQHNNIVAGLKEEISKRGITIKKLNAQLESTKRPILSDLGEP